jgi:hypothetical protein
VLTTTSKPWWLMVVNELQDKGHKGLFVEELEVVRD